MSFLKHLFQPRLKSAFLIAQRDMIEKEHLTPEDYIEYLESLPDKQDLNDVPSGHMYQMTTKCTFNLPTGEAVSIVHQKRLDTQIQRPFCCATVTDFKAGQAMMFYAAKRGKGQKLSVHRLKPSEYKA